MLINSSPETVLPYRFDKSNEIPYRIQFLNKIYRGDSYGQSKDLQSAYSLHLQSVPWHYFATFTFHRIRHDGSNAVSALWERLPNVSRAFFAVEKFKLDGIHVHALLQPASLENSSPASSPSRLQAYTTKTFGWSKVEWVGGSAGVADYCSKYVTGQKSYDYFFMPYDRMAKYWWRQ